MSDYQILRIYFRYGQKSRKLSFWKKLWSSTLSDRLLKTAKRQNIYQANIFIAEAGYLKYTNLTYKVSELPSQRNTVCVELVDTEHILQTFLKNHNADLQEAISILLQPEIRIIK